MAEPFPVWHFDRFKFAAGTMIWIIISEIFPQAYRFHRIFSWFGFIIGGIRDRYGSLMMGMIGMIDRYVEITGLANDRVIMARERGESLKHVLFVCTGNTCRSPMAEALLRQMAKEEGLDIDVKSAGISAIEGTTSSRYAIEALQEKGIVLDHQSKAVDQDLVHWADIILTMTQSHKQALIHHFPNRLTRFF